MFADTAAANINWEKLALVRALLCVDAQEAVVMRWCCYVVFVKRVDADVQVASRIGVLWREGGGGSPRETVADRPVTVFACAFALRCAALFR